MKKFLFSAVALIGFTVVSYGANTVEKVEVLAVSDPRSICEKLREFVYQMILPCMEDEQAACELATLVEDTCMEGKL